ncbi:MAG: TrkH family potassium uptake protein [Proteobacteria bacterium]|nr:TrkH family potassium uptake protein [Desulfobulbaceae bacterium]MBU4154076.1 TrkH family potassium uptake protein [Pseudomonadota bacterium]MDP2106295.1 TrkH family potassium uptake protein [Desulfobulbaceae bacterium]
MRIGGVLNLFGKLLISLSLFLLLPIPFSLYFNDGMIRVFLLCSLFGATLGSLFIAVFVADEDLGFRDGFAVVVLAWLGLAFLGAFPYYLCGKVPSFIDCFFESMSGFTTTGSTILGQVEILPESVHFWRATTHWLGGMGIIVLSLAILPLIGAGGMQMFQAEMPGPTKDRLAPRIQDTARILWTVYVLFTGVEIVLLMLGGLSFYDAICHSFATLATGGFSTHNSSVGYFQSAYVEAVIIVFMFLAGINFSLHYHGLRGNLKIYWQNEEFRLYLGFIGLAFVVILGANLFHGVYQSLGQQIRAALFQVVSIITTTGFGTADFEQWPPMCKFFLVALMFVGGCAGSTGGGIKVFRFLLFFKYARLQLRKLVHPRGVYTIQVGQVKVPRDVKVAILGFFSLYTIVFFLACLGVTATGVDIVTGTTAVAATLNNIGPGLQQVGPAQHFGGLPAVAKLILTFCMLAGRLELYTVAVLFMPGYWSLARKPIYRWQVGKKSHHG